MRKDLFKKIITTASLFLFSICQMPLPALAADQLYSITLSPMTQRMILTPGEKYVGTILVSNPAASSQNLEYELSVSPFSQASDGESQDDYGRVDSSTVSNYNQIMNWITFDKKTGTVAPNGTDTVTYAINTPSDAPAGGQYAMIVVSDAAKTKDTNVKGYEIQGTIQVGSIIYAEVAGETRESGEIKENAFPSFLMNNTLEATSMVKNNGNVHTDAKYSFQVWPLFSDEEICTNEENPESSLIMPETERYHVQKCTLPIVGIFRAKQVVKIFGEESILEKTIIVCPLWLLVIIIFVIIALITWIIVRAKSRKTTTKAPQQV